MPTAQHTAGPWYWHTDHAGNVSLRTPDRGNLIVMDFTRRGMQGAAPRLAYWTGLPGGLPRERCGGVMDEFSAEHPDAALIASAPELLAALEAVIRYCVTPQGFPDKKHRTPEQQAAYESALKILRTINPL